MLMNSHSFEHPDSNGWALYEPEYIESDSERNIHVVEARVKTDGNGNTSARPIPTRKTMCGPLRLIAGGRMCLIASTSANEIRTEICRLQNEGHEVCGQCVARFYAGPEA